MSRREKWEGEGMDLYGNVTRDRRRTRSTKFFDPKVLHERNHEILNLHALGLKNTQIAKAIGVTPQTVCNTVTSSLGQEKLLAMRGSRDQKTLEILDRIDSMQEKALDTLEEILLDDERASLSLKRTTAMNILVDLGGYGAPKKLDIRSTTAVLPPEFFEQLREQGRKAVEESEPSS
jgi:DNA-binding CsgD family transcriptional regulator